MPVQQDMFLQAEEQRATNIKWSSPSQMLALFQHLVPKLEDVNGKNLNKHKYKHPIIKSYIRYKELSKLANAYGTNFFNYVNCDGKVHTNSRMDWESFILNLTCNRYQPITSIVTVLSAQMVGCSYLVLQCPGADVIAFGSKDPVWLDALERGLDLHGVCADTSSKTRRDADADERKSSGRQTISFGLAYGMGP